MKCLGRLFAVAVFCSLVLLRTPRSECEDLTFLDALKRQVETAYSSPDLYTAANQLLRFAKAGKADEAAFWRSVGPTHGWKLLPDRYRFDVQVGPNNPYRSPCVYRLLAFPAGGKWMLFGCAEDAADSDRIYRTARELLEQQASTADDDQRRRWKDSLSPGPDRWPFLLVELSGPKEASIPSGAPLSIDGDVLSFDVDGRPQRAGFVDPTTLAAYIGRPFDRVSLPQQRTRPSAVDTETRPPANGVVLAVDWSEYVERRPEWLLRELKHALAASPDLPLRVVLQTPTRSIWWPPDKLAQGEWPDVLPKGHHLQTPATLEAFLFGLPSDEGSSRVAFLTWNPESSIPKAEYATLPSTLVQSSQKTKLQILQFHGERIPSLAGLTDERSYNIFEFREDGPPVLQWPWRP